MVKKDYVADLLKIFSVFAVCNLKLCEESLGIAEFRFVAVAFSPLNKSKGICLSGTLCMLTKLHIM